VTASLRIRADADPQTLPRILGLLSQRWLVPSLFSARRDGDVLDIRCSVPELTGPAAVLVVAKLEQIVLVHAVEVLAGA
jgi:acetolactate synthase regulatory subunit